METVKLDAPMPDGNKCPQCGTPLPIGSLAGLCPSCLLKMGAGADTVTEGKQPPFNPPPVAELAAKFPQLEILELIGKGGMGAVYKARQKQLDRIVALKILPPGMGDDPAFAGRFAREAKALAKLNHPNIVTLYEFGDAGGQFYFLMEFVDGVNLRQLLQAGRISAREALAIVPQICDALQFAHDQGIIHRDIKPENILLDRRGRVKVADFGLAKIMGNEGRTELPGSPNIEAAQQHGPTGVMGTPNYMSPEQITAPGEVDHRADIYALGVVFYQMLTGELPGKQLQPPSTKVQIDVRLDEVVLRALEKNPGLRFQQVSEVKTCVENISTMPIKQPLTQKTNKNMTEYKFYCPQCGKQIQCDVSYAGTQIDCPICRQSIVVPQPSSAAVAVPAPMKSLALRNVLVAVAAVVVLAGLVIGGWYGCTKIRMHKYPPGLVALWSGDGNGNDSVGGNNGMLVGGATLATGKVGQAFSFNGANQFVQVPDSPSLEPTSITLECWFKAGNTVGGQLVGKPLGGRVYDSYSIWLQNGDISGIICNSGAQGTPARIAFTPVPGVWYHVAYTFDSASQTQTLYLNGYPVVSNNAGIQMGYDSHPVMIGADSDFGSTTLPWTGEINEVSLYNRALSASEIQAIYTEQK